MENLDKAQAAEFIPIYGYYKLCQRSGKRGEAHAEAFIDDVKNNNFYEVNVRNPITNKLNKVAFGYSESEFDYELKDEIKELGLCLYHAATFIGLALSPLIYKGLENLMK